MRPVLERLEDRTLLDGATDASSPAIVVGRTLSSYFAGDIENSQETITYTVYNQQADPETGVLLTTTLSQGVAYQSALQQPDMSGQNLAWSLGTINGFDRASVTLTLVLPSPTPTQLDTGAQAFATLDAGAVSASTPPAALNPGSLSDSTLLASTPDANTTDPFIQEAAAQLDYDPNQIFNFLHTQIGYNSYAGSMRGARGTLWSSAGNALDVASLGVALMRASGIPAQYVSGTLSQSQAQQLVLSMFPAADQVVGGVPAGAHTSDPAADPQLLSETESHDWFQFDTGDAMENADPLMTGTIGQTVTISSGSFTEVPDNLRAETTIEIVAEIANTADSLFGQSGETETTVLDQTFNDVDLVGHPLSIGNRVTSSGTSAIFSSTTNTYAPYISVGDEGYSIDQDTVITGSSYQEVLTRFPFGSQVLTGVFLKITATAPGGATQTDDRTLFDRIGYAARQGDEPVKLSVDPTGPPAFSQFDIFTVNALPGLQSPAVGYRLAAELSSIQSSLAELNTCMNGAASQSPEAAFLLTEYAIDSSRLQAEQQMTLSDEVTGEVATLSEVRAYFDQPRVIIYLMRP